MQGLQAPVEFSSHLQALLNFSRTVAVLLPRKNLEIAH